jgi:hypothetical protein
LQVGVPTDCGIFLPVRQAGSSANFCPKRLKATVGEDAALLHCIYWQTVFRGNRCCVFGKSPQKSGEKRCQTSSGRPVGNTHAPAFWAIFVKNVRFDEANQDSQKRQNEKDAPFFAANFENLGFDKLLFPSDAGFSCPSGRRVIPYMPLTWQACISAAFQAIFAQNATHWRLSTYHSRLGTYHFFSKQPLSGAEVSSIFAAQNHASGGKSSP